MKRSWFSILMFAGVLGLLALFLALQYRWLREVSEAESDRMQKRVAADVARFGEDFNREMQAAYYNFQIDGDAWNRGDWAEFNKRYEFWRQRTSYPELVRGIYYFSKESASAQPLKYDAAKQAFEQVEADANLQQLHGKFSNDESFRPFYDDSYAMVLPIYHGSKSVEHILIRKTQNAGKVPEKATSRSEDELAPRMRIPDKVGWLVILLDEPTIKDRIVPDFAAKYFPEKDYALTIFNREDQPIVSTAATVTQPDASTPLFDLSPDNLMFFSSDALPRMMDEHKKGAVVIDQRVENRSTYTRTETITGKTGTFQVQLQHEPDIVRPRKSVMAGTPSGDKPGAWMLRAQHTAGSIDAFVISERNKSFLVGLGVCILLVSGIVAILLSAMRSRAFAQRQLDFVSSVSHEFRTPLAVIYSAGENLADGVAKEDAQVSRYGELIKGEGKKLSGMVEQILEFAGANSGHRQYKFALADPIDIVNDALAESQALIDSGEFTVETNFQKDLPMISADRTALSSAIQNLVANSVKYSNGSKWIGISAVNGGGSVKIMVEDKGLGIASDEQRKIFEPFYRSKQVVDAQISGNGLGLNLVKKIVEAHGGEITVESRPGEGSTFTIKIPQQ